jgi:outer membrane protein assembly factor BamA
VRGNTYTDRDVVLRKSGVHAGDPFSYTSMLEAQRDLYRLGIFQRVEVQPQEAGAESGKRDVVMQVEEGRDLTVTGSVGLRADRGPDVASGTQFHERLSGAIAHRNLFGTGRYLGLEGVFSRDQQEAFLTYREPFITRWNLPVQLQIFQSNDSTRSGATIQQRGTSVETDRVFALNTRLSLRYEYRISECVEGELCRQLESNQPVEGLDPSLRSIQISSITPTFFWDRRDDILDPHRGFFTSASIEYAFPLFAADAGFFREYFQGAFYLPVTARSVLALSGRAGMIQPYARGDVNNDGIKELLAIALSERFTAGGETSHRAFPPDRLGDLCLNRDLTVQQGCEPTLLGVFDASGKNLRTILPLGGDSMFVVNAEYRFPIAGTFGGAVFADIGNVFAGSQIHFDDLRYGTGIGFRYLSPVGPLRLDIGVPLHRRWYEDSFQYFFTLGYAF